jgi:hypothetical protein
MLPLRGAFYLGLTLAANPTGVECLPLQSTGAIPTMSYYTAINIVNMAFFGLKNRGVLPHNLLKTLPYLH